MLRTGQLPLKFYQDEQVVDLAKSLLGCLLCTDFIDGFTCGTIVETEAYRAPEDKASHAYNGRRTSRTETMYAAGGISYIYLCYGIHHLFNVVTGPKDAPHAVLVRAIEPIKGMDIMLRRRNLKKISPRLTAGPGSLAQALGLHKEHNGQSLCDPSSPIWIQEGRVVAAQQITASPRVGVGYAEECAAWPWRFRVRDSIWTSPAK